MGKFTRDEIEQAVRHYTTVVEGCSVSGDWRPFADLFTEDVVYTEHHYGVFHGREAVREWIVAVMAPFPHMRFPSDWIAYDDDNDAVVLMIKNLLDHPTDPNGEPFWFPELDSAGLCRQWPVFQRRRHLQPKPGRAPCRGRLDAGWRPAGLRQDFAAQRLTRRTRDGAVASAAATGPPSAPAPMQAGSWSLQVGRFDTVSGKQRRRSGFRSR